MTPSLNQAPGPRSRLRVQDSTAASPSWASVSARAWEKWPRGPGETQTEAGDSHPGPQGPASQATAAWHPGRPPGTPSPSAGIPPEQGGEGCFLDWGKDPPKWGGGTDKENHLGLEVEPGGPSQAIAPTLGFLGENTSAGLASGSGTPGGVLPLTIDVQPALCATSAAAQVMQGLPASVFTQSLPSVPCVPSSRLLPLASGLILCLPLRGSTLGAPLCSGLAPKWARPV